MLIIIYKEIKFVPNIHIIVEKNLFSRALAFRRIHLFIINLSNKTISVGFVYFLIYFI